MRRRAPALLALLSLAGSEPCLEITSPTLATPIVAASVQIYEKVGKDLLPTPARSHYTFNLRDISRVFQGTPLELLIWSVLGVVVVMVVLVHVG